MKSLIVNILESLVVRYEPQLIAAGKELVQRLGDRYQARLVAWLDSLTPPPALPAPQSPAETPVAPPPAI